MTYEPMADAAFAPNIPPGFQVAAGYYGGPAAYHVWPSGDWARFPGYRLPIWVGGTEGSLEGVQARATLQGLGVPAGAYTVLDMEARSGAADIAYAEAFGDELRAAGYKTWVYGSAGMVFRLPPLNGYWPAVRNWTMVQVMDLLATTGVRAVQYAAYPGYDASLVKQWAEGEMWHG